MAGGVMIAGQVALSWLMLGISSLSSSARLVALGWAGAMVVPVILQATVFVAADQPAWAPLIGGPLPCAWMAVTGFVSPEGSGPWAWAALGVMALWGVVGAGLFARQVSRLEEVS